MTDPTETTTVTVEVPVPEHLYERAEARAENGDRPLEEYLCDYVLLDPEFTTPDTD